MEMDENRTKSGFDANEILFDENSILCTFSSPIAMMSFKANVKNHKIEKNNYKFQVEIISELDNSKIKCSIFCLR